MKKRSDAIALPPAPGPALSVLLIGFACLCWLLLLVDMPFVRFALAMLTEALSG